MHETLVDAATLGTTPQYTPIPEEVSERIARELTEQEEAVALIVSGRFDEQAALNAQFEDALHLVPPTPPLLRPPPRMKQPVNEDSLAQALAPEVRKGTNRVLNQPSAEEFLSRDFHSLRANRFLFSSADDPDGCAMNKGTAWQYAIPETGSGASSSSDHGPILGQIGRLPGGGRETLATVPEDPGPSTTAAGKAPVH